MRKGSSPFWLARWAVVAAIPALQGGCEKKQPVPPTASPPVVAPQAIAPATPVPLGESFVLSNVRFRHDEEQLDLVASYKVSNRGDKRERVYLCVDYIDKDGYFVKRDELDHFSLQPGDSDQGVDARAHLTGEHWTVTEALRFYMDKQPCSPDSTERRSAFLFFDKFGQQLPPGTQPEPKTSEADDWELPSPWFRMESVRMFQDEHEAVLLEFKLTNLTKGRASGRVCIRIAEDPSCSCELAKMELEDVDLGLGASDRQLVRLELKDKSDWDKNLYLTTYASQYGCVSNPAQIHSNVVTLTKPRSIHAPTALLEDAEGLTPEQFEELMREYGATTEEE